MSILPICITKSRAGKVLRVVSNNQFSRLANSENIDPACQYLLPDFCNCQGLTYTRCTLGKVEIYLELYDLRC